MFLNNIKKLCKQKDITITELERNLQFGNGTIHRWSQNQPSADKLLKVAKYFNTSLDYLFSSELNLPSNEARSFAETFDSLSEEQKNLVKCYISIIKKEVC